MLNFSGALQILGGSPSDLKVGTKQLFLGSDSPWIVQHHTNWRLHTLAHLPERSKADLNYSSAVTLSVEDSVHAREILVQAIEKLRALVRETGSSSE
jgi:hypothetical protein